MDFVFPIAVLIFSVVVHEVAHGLSALWMGDPTAKYAGRLTLNPISHLDLFGSVIVPTLMFVSTGFIFGWAKPVPYNPFNLRDQKYGPAIVGLAGPMSNLILALLGSAGLRTLMLLNVSEGFFLYKVLAFLVFINVLLLVFNMFPIPPLDGSKLLFAILPISEHTKFMLEKYGFAFLIIFILFFGSLISFVLGGVLGFFSDFFIGANIQTFLK